jgi:hypothetical protein
MALMSNCQQLEIERWEPMQLRSANPGHEHGRKMLVEQVGSAYNINVTAILQH